MTIQINQSFFLPKLKTYAENNRPQFQDNSVDLARDILDVAQGWFDSKPWEKDKIENYDTQRECRIELKRYIKDHLDLNNQEATWFVPEYVWKWTAKYVVNYVVKLIIEHYWEDIMQEIGIEP